MDVVSFHKTPKILELLRGMNVTIALIPPGLTSLLQPLDTAIDGPLKVWLKEYADLYIAEWEREHPGRKWTIGDKRVMTTFIVAKAVKRLQEEAGDMIRHAFKQTGISIRPDGVEVTEIKIKGVDRSQIDWANWETAEAIPISAKHEEVAMTTLEEISTFVTAEEAEKAVEEAAEAVEEAAEAVEAGVGDENTTIRVIGLTAVEAEI